MRSFTLAAITSLAVCALEVEGRVATLLLGVGLLLMGMVPPFLNGRAVFANKHALALAHASGGGKCKRRVPYPKGAHRAVCTSAARKIRVPLARARGGASQEGLVSLRCAERVEMLL
jgi:hypothetical protein